MQFPDEMNFAGDYRLKDVVLHTINGEKIDIKNLLIELNVYESINKNSIYGNIIIRDSSNLIYYKSLCGQEKISFLLYTPGATGNNRIDFKEFNARVYKISDITRTIEREQSYRLHFTTQEAIRNTRTRISRAYEDTPSEIVKTILRDPNIIATKKNIFVEKTVNSHKLIAPNVRPFDFIRTIKKRSESQYDKNTGYLFYENHRGYNFRSFSSLTHKNNEPKEVVEKYTVTSQSRASDDPSFRDIGMDMRAIRKYTIMKKNDYLANVSTGMLGSTHYTHDIHTKTFTKTQTDYFSEFNIRKHVDDEYGFSPLYSRILPETFDNKNVGEFPKSNIYVSPRATKLHSQSVSDPREYDNRSNIWLQKYIETFLNFDSIRLQLEVAGNTYIAVGDIIDVQLPSLEPIQKKSDDNYDKHLSGRWLITDIRHIVDVREHQMVIECVRDTYHSGLFAVSQPIGDDEPSMKSTISINTENDAS